MQTQLPPECQAQLDRLFRVAVREGIDAADLEIKGKMSGVGNYKQAYGGQ